MSGNVVEVYGRKLRDDLRAGTPKHLYLPSQAGRGRGVFNVQALAASREIILCEALIDALTFWCAGYPPIAPENSTVPRRRRPQAVLRRAGRRAACGARGRRSSWPGKAA